MENIMSVSYTHLDVYKRQDNNNATTRKLTYTTEDSEDYEIILVQDRNNDWKIYMPDIYVSNYKYKAEKSLTTYINGIEVTSDYIEKSNGVVDDNYTTYDICLLYTSRCV